MCLPACYVPFQGTQTMRNYSSGHFNMIMTNRVAQEGILQNDKSLKISIEYIVAESREVDIV